MQSDQAEHFSAANLRRRARANHDLVSLAAPVLEIVLRIRAGIVQPSVDLRQQIDALVKEMEARGATLRYPPEQVQAVKFALAAFVDETVLTADFPLRDEWEKYPLQLQYFGEHLAGVKFFERLDSMTKQTEQNAEAIEVYYLCMLLGFKGKYKIYLEEELKGVIRDTADRLRAAGRLRHTELSPHWRVDDQPPPPEDPGLPLWMKIGGGASVGFVILAFMIFKFMLDRSTSEEINQLLR